MKQTLRTPTDADDLENAIRGMLAQVWVIHGDMDRDQAEIERLKQETAELKAEGAALKAESRAVLATLARADRTGASTRDFPRKHVTPMGSRAH